MDSNDDLFSDQVKALLRAILAEEPGARQRLSEFLWPYVPRPVTDCLRRWPDPFGDPPEDYFTSVCDRMVEALPRREAKDVAAGRSTAYPKRKIRWFAWYCTLDERKSREGDGVEPVELTEVTVSRAAGHSRSAEEEVVLREQKRRLHRCIEELPERQRQMVKWHHFEELNMSEIARQLDVHPSNVLRPMRQALAMLKRCLQADEPPVGGGHSG